MGSAVARASDKVTIIDELRMRGVHLDGSTFDIILETIEKLNREPIEVHGFFRAQLRERGKLVRGSLREGGNIWTFTGREYAAQVKSYSDYSPLTKARSDGIRYIGFGTGSQPEVSTVDRVVQPIAFDIAGNFMAQVAIATYPLSPAKTTARYTRSFNETELSVTGTVILTEAGLYTDGDPLQSFAPDTRDITLAAAASQKPNAYKTFEALKKTQNFILETSWELRH